MNGINIKPLITKPLEGKKVKKTSSQKVSHSSVFNVSDTENFVNQNVNSASLIDAQTINPLFSNLFQKPSYQKSFQKAEEVLDNLEKIRIGLVEGMFKLSVIEELIQLTENMPSHENKEIQKIIEEIKTRALVEVAKLEKL